MSFGFFEFFAGNGNFVANVAAGVGLDVGVDVVEALVARPVDNLHCSLIFRPEVIRKALSQNKLVFVPDLIFGLELEAFPKV